MTQETKAAIQITATQETKAAIQITTWEAWYLTLRPKTLSVSLVPVLVATLLARSELGEINWFLVAAGLLTVLAIQIGTNFINDSIDVTRGTDTHERLGPMRGVHYEAISTGAVFKAGLGALGLAFVFGTPLIMEGGVAITLLLLLSVLLAYGYSGGPYPIASLGLSDPFAFLFFGIICLNAIYYVLTGFVTREAILAGTQIGLFAAAISAINNLRDCKSDELAHRYTLPVRFGATFARCELTLLLLGPFALASVWMAWGYEFTGLLPCIALPFALRLLYRLWVTSPSVIYNQFLARAALLHLVFGLLLGISFYND